MRSDTAERQVVPLHVIHRLVEALWALILMGTGTVLGGSKIVDSALTEV